MTTKINSILYTLLSALLTFSLASSIALAGSEEYENEANDTINTVEKQLAELNKLINEADEKNIFIGYAEEAWDEAKELLEEAEEEDINEDWDDAYEYAKEAEEILEDAIDDLEDDIQDEVDPYLEKAEAYIEAADKALDDTDKDFVKYDEADDLFDQAEKVFDDAKEEYEDQDYNEAIDLALDVVELIEDSFLKLNLQVDDYLYLDEKDKDDEEEDVKEEKEDDEDDKDLAEENAILRDQINQLLGLIALLTTLLGL